MKTDNIEKAIAQLPTIALDSARQLVRPLRRAEEAMAAAEAAYNAALLELAAEISDPDDGWTGGEIYRTALRGNKIFMDEVRRLSRERADRRLCQR